jgi:xylulokinase
LTTALEDRFLLAVDLGTSGCKAALVDEQGRVAAWAFRPVELHVVETVGVEQDPEQWWRALVEAARQLLAPLHEAGGEIAAICCSCQGECTVPVDRQGRPLMRALSWMDMRGRAEIRRIAGGRLLSIAGYDPLKLWRWIRLTGGAPSLSGKDPAGHIAFLRQARPEIVARTYKFLNALDYIHLRLTGRFAATADSILTTWVTDNRDAGRIHYDPALLSQTGIDGDKLPEIVPSAEVLGTLTSEAAGELGLPPSTRVVAGAVDNSAAAIGAGTVADGDAHLYLGTSSWLGAHVSAMKTDVAAEIASVPGAIPGRYLAVALQSAAGSNLTNFLRRFHTAQPAGESGWPAESFREIEALAAVAPAGARGLLYMPWLCGERTPASNPHLRAGLLNLSLEHTRAEMARAVLEGVALNTRWMLGPFRRFLSRPVERITVVGGCAASDLWCQILADALAMPVRQVAAPIQANAVGAALIGLVGIGQLRWEEIPRLIRIRNIYQPDPERAALYRESFGRFTEAARLLAPLYRRWNRRAE